jgi:hypothetical protein
MTRSGYLESVTHIMLMFMTNANHSGMRHQVDDQQPVKLQHTGCCMYTSHHGHDVMQASPRLAHD